jgi:hypothetical protein
MKRKLKLWLSKIHPISTKRRTTNYLSIIRRVIVAYSGGMVTDATFNNISAIWWWSVLFVEETGVPEKITDLQQVTDIMLYRVHISWVGFELTTLVVIGTDCICSYRFTYWSSDTYEWQLWRDITQCVMYRTLVNIRTFFLLKTNKC